MKGLVCLAVFLVLAFSTSEVGFEGLEANSAFKQREEVSEDDIFATRAPNEEAGEVPEYVDAEESEKEDLKDSKEKLTE